MRLCLYSSRTRSDEANLVAIQDERLSGLPTVLVCPLRTDLTVTPLRPVVHAGGRRYVVACDLAHPINRKALHQVGSLAESDSQQVLTTFQRLLAR